MSYKVSIIIPVYNIERYIVKCMDSIVNQSYTNIEIIPIDDGSTDGSGKILDEYAAKDSRIKVIHQENGGLISTRRKGLLSSTSDYICFVDGDDSIELDNIELLVKKQSETDADIVIGSYQRIKDDGRIKTHPIFQNNGMTASEYIPLLLQGDILWSIWIKLYRKSIFPKDFASFSRSYTMGEDAICNSQLLPYVKKIATEPKAMYNYYIHDTSISNTHKRTLEYNILMINAIANAMGEELANKYQSIINTRLVSLAYYTLCLQILQYNETYTYTEAHAHIKALIQNDKNITKRFHLKKRVILTFLFNPFWINLIYKICSLIKQGKGPKITPTGDKYTSK